MKRTGISQEGLKLIACVTMLIDHVGALFFPGQMLWRMVGRLAFPIYCFLLSEGAYHTRHPKQYVLRIALMALVTEGVYDLAFSGSLGWYRKNVMFTLLLGYLGLLVMEKCPAVWKKVLAILPFVLAAELLSTDYGAEGILVIALFALTRDMASGSVLQMLGLGLIFGSMSSICLLQIGSFRITLQLLGVLAMVPISLYSGQKVSQSKTLQWAFYLFYPVHIGILALLRCWIFDFSPFG